MVYFEFCNLDSEVITLAFVGLGTWRIDVANHNLR